jgi:hypothetical protein
VGAGHLTRPPRPRAPPPATRSWKPQLRTRQYAGSGVGVQCVGNRLGDLLHEGEVDPLLLKTASCLTGNDTMRGSPEATSKEPGIPGFLLSGGPDWDSSSNLKTPLEAA